MFRQHYTIWPFKPLYFRHVKDFIHVFTASNCWIYIILIGSILLPPATKLGQGNIFRSVCQEFCSRGGCLPHCMLGNNPAGTRGRQPPQDQRQAPPGTRGRHPPPGGTHPTGMQSCFDNSFNTI